MSTQMYKHLWKLNVGVTRPNMILPVFYGALERLVDGNTKDEIADSMVLVWKNLSKSEKQLLKDKVSWYKNLPEKVKLVWSGDEYVRLYKAKKFEKVASNVLRREKETEIIRRWARGGYLVLPVQYGHKTYPGLQPNIIYPDSGVPTPSSGILIDPLRGGQMGGPYTVPPGQPAPQQPPANNKGCCPPPDQPGQEPSEDVDLSDYAFMWELGPDMHCDDPFEDRLGDDVYCVAGWADGSGNVAFKRIPESANYALNDMDAGEHGTWPFPERIIYPANNPGNYLHIEIDFWEHDSTLDFLASMLDFLNEIMAGVGAAIGLVAGGPGGVAAGAAIGAAVGDGLGTIRSWINDKDDDNLLGTLAFDYPEGSRDLFRLAGSRRAPLIGRDSGEHWEYAVDYVIRIA